MWSADAPVHASERRKAAAREADRRALGESIGQLIAAADDREDLSSQLVHADLQEQLLDGWLGEPAPSSPFDEPFTHIIVDEAQDLSDAQWDMVKRRCPSGSLTIVGDPAQAAGGFAESWQQRLQRVGIDAVRVGSLRVNYRSAAQIMRAAAATLHAALPGANVPLALREDGKPVRYADPGQLERILGRWLDENPQGIAAVIGAPGFPGGDRVFSLQVEQAKGLEFDLVLLVRTEQYGTDASAAVRRYVAMTRATAELVVLIKSAVPGIE